MVRSLLIRGMLVGAVAGLLAFAFAYVFGEPQVQHAIDFEEQLARRGARARRGRRSSRAARSARSAC